MRGSSFAESVGNCRSRNSFPGAVIGREGLVYLVLTSVVCYVAAILAVSERGRTTIRGFEGGSTCGGLVRSRTSPVGGSSILRFVSPFSSSSEGGRSPGHVGRQRRRIPLVSFTLTPVIYFPKGPSKDPRPVFPKRPTKPGGGRLRPPSHPYYPPPPPSNDPCLPTPSPSSPPSSPSPSSPSPSPSSPSPSSPPSKFPPFPPSKYRPRRMSTVLFASSPSSSSPSSSGPPFEEGESSGAASAREKSSGSSDGNGSEGTLHKRWNEEEGWNAAGEKDGRPAEKMERWMENGGVGVSSTPGSSSSSSSMSSSVVSSLGKTTTTGSPTKNTLLVFPSSPSSVVSLVPARPYYLDTILSYAPSELVSLFFSSESKRLRDAVRLTVTGLVGGLLGRYSIDSLVLTTIERLSLLFFQLQVTGYLFKCADYRFELEQCLVMDLGPSGTTADQVEKHQESSPLLGVQNWFNQWRKNVNKVELRFGHPLETKKDYKNVNYLTPILDYLQHNKTLQMDAQNGYPFFAYESANSTFNSQPNHTHHLDTVHPTTTATPMTTSKPPVLGELHFYSSSVASDSPRQNHTTGEVDTTAGVAIVDITSHIRRLESRLRSANAQVEDLRRTLHKGRGIHNHSTVILQDNHTGSNLSSTIGSVTSPNATTPTILPSLLSSPLSSPPFASSSPTTTTLLSTELLSYINRLGSSSLTALTGSMSPAVLDAMRLVVAVIIEGTLPHARRLILTDNDEENEDEEDQGEPSREREEVYGQEDEEEEDDEDEEEEEQEADTGGIENEKGKKKKRKDEKYAMSSRMNHRMSPIHQSDKEQQRNVSAAHPAMSWDTTISSTTGSGSNHTTSSGTSNFSRTSSISLIRPIRPMSALDKYRLDRRQFLPKRNLSSKHRSRRIPSSVSSLTSPLRNSFSPPPLSELIVQQSATALSHLCMWQMAVGWYLRVLEVRRNLQQMWKFGESNGGDHGGKGGGSGEGGGGIRDGGGGARVKMVETVEKGEKE